MLDYYGSIKYTLDEIKIKLYDDYKDYSKSYIEKIINKLVDEKKIYQTYSYSGWGVFHKKNVVALINKYIEDDTLLIKKKLKLLQYCYENNYPVDLISRI